VFETRFPALSSPEQIDVSIELLCHTIHKCVEVRLDVAGASLADLTSGRMRSSGIGNFIREKRRSFTETGTPRILTVSTRKWLLHGTDLREN
jgi:hypothetical protein